MHLLYIYAYCIFVLLYIVHVVLLFLELISFKTTSYVCLIYSLLTFALTCVCTLLYLAYAFMFYCVQAYMADVRTHMYALAHLNIYEAAVQIRT